MESGKNSKFAGPLRVLERDDPQALLAEARNVLDLSHHPGYGFVMGLIEERVRNLERRIYAEGEPLSQSQYARFAGEVVGLRSLSEAVSTVLLIAEQVDERQERAAKLAAV